MNPVLHDLRMLVRIQNNFSITLTKTLEFYRSSVHKVVLLIFNRFKCYAAHVKPLPPMTNSETNFIWPPLVHYIRTPHLETSRLTSPPWVEDWSLLVSISSIPDQIQFWPYAATATFFLRVACQDLLCPQTQQQKKFVLLHKPSRRANSDS